MRALVPTPFIAQSCAEIRQSLVRRGRLGIYFSANLYFAGIGERSPRRVRDRQPDSSEALLDHARRS